MRKYGKTHVWIEDGKLGLTARAADEMQGIVYLEVNPGEYAEGDAFGAVESSKAVVDLVAPCSMRVTGANPVAVADPSVVDSDPEGVWIAMVEDVDESLLLDENPAD